MKLDEKETSVVISELSGLDHDDIKLMVYDFEHCGVHGGCEHCKCYENLNNTRCNICELLLTYRKDISDKIRELIDNM